MQESRIQKRKMDLGYLKRLAEHELAVRLEELESLRIRRKVQLDHELTDLRQTIWQMHMMLTNSLIHNPAIKASPGERPGGGRGAGAPDGVDGGAAEKAERGRPRAARRRSVNKDDPPIWHIPRPKYVDLSKDQKDKHATNENSFVLLVQKYRELKLRPPPSLSSKPEAARPKPENHQRVLVIPALTRSKTYTWGTVPKQKVSVEDWASSSSLSVTRRRTIDFTNSQALEPITNDTEKNTGMNSLLTEPNPVKENVETILEVTTEDTSAKEYVSKDVVIKSTQYVDALAVGNNV